MNTRESVPGRRAGDGPPQEDHMPGVVVYPRVNEHGTGTPVTYPNATAWKGTYADGVTIYQDADVIASWDAGTWDHVETADARTQRDTTDAELNAMQTASDPYCPVTDCTGDHPTPADHNNDPNAPRRPHTT